MKIGLIDSTNSTNISRYKRFISVVELAKIIKNINNIDQRIKDGDPTVVAEIARSNGKINLFSFASKYCCYHNNAFGRDDYSIYDTIIEKHLPDYFNDITTKQLQFWKRKQNYEKFNEYINRKLLELNITIENKRRKFDHFIWFNNRTKNN